MPFTWVKPCELSVLAGRPLLDLGVGDGQTHRALVEPSGLVVGADRSLAALRTAKLARRVGAQARALPFADETFEVVMAGDLVHHLDHEELREVLAEVRRVLRPGGRFVAWWYEQPGRPAPDAPRFPRPGAEVQAAAVAAGFSAAEDLELEVVLEPAPPTTGLVATR